MGKRRPREFRRCFSAQTAVDAGGSQPVLGAGIAHNASDRNELAPNLGLGFPEKVRRFQRDAPAGRHLPVRRTRPR